MRRKKFGHLGAMLCDFERTGDENYCLGGGVRGRCLYFGLLPSLFFRTCSIWRRIFYFFTRSSAAQANCSCYRKSIIMTATSLCLDYIYRRHCGIKEKEL